MEGPQTGKKVNSIKQNFNLKNNIYQSKPTYHILTLVHQCTQALKHNEQANSNVFSSFSTPDINQKIHK